jgi:hypothetical protein
MEPRNTRTTEKGRKRGSTKVLGGNKKSEGQKKELGILTAANETKKTGQHDGKCKKGI